MKNSVIIKSTRHGLLVHMDADVPYEDLKAEIAEKFSASRRFFRKSAMAVSFGGRSLTHTQEKEIVRLISDTADIMIPCIVDMDEEHDAFYQSAVEHAKEREEPVEESDGRFYKGTLRKNEFLETDTSLVILGDVERGAVVVSKGNVTVIGRIDGSVHAGCAGDRNAVISALSMEPKELKIADIRWDPQRTKDEENNVSGAKKAFIEGNSFVFQSLAK